MIETTGRYLVYNPSKLNLELLRKLIKASEYEYKNDYTCSFVIRLWEEVLNSLL